ncbi:retrotransposon-like family member (retr-1) [Vairimorpha apis BRL 01]|uniref:Retrotransposon-like family member (Retr-1) n=1 Tax=Vairimorpha apis BRL 01 TaxID=1037528 RepID=T0KW83_9MICR|nr:retrotransposon-like family member (retr-1) [Vairimorpha apis BRL 01]
MKKNNLNKRFNSYQFEEDNKVFKPRGCEKRVRLTLDDVKERYWDIFENLKDEEIGYCKLEKCKIPTKEGEKIVRKGHTIPQALIKETEEYIRELENRKVIKRSKSEWRNPIRAIQKPNGEVRIVSNFIELNDLVEKDPYELLNMRDILRATQG